MGINDEKNYVSVFGEDPAFVHLEDGKRVAFAEEVTDYVTGWMHDDAQARGDIQSGASLPVCPGCAVTVSFNLANILGERHGFTPSQIADAMLRLWQEVKDRGEFFTSERSGIRQED